MLKEQQERDNDDHTSETFDKYFILFTLIIPTVPGVEGRKGGGEKCISFTQRSGGTGVTSEPSRAKGHFERRCQGCDLQRSIQLEGVLVILFGKGEARQRREESAQRREKEREKINANN